ncbi:TPA: hypothetical protein ACF23B_003727 [Klebsiella quasipneumoniae subsp. similipneumoniae]
MNIETVNELIASLESAGELSIREQKFLKLAKEFSICSASLDAAIKTGNMLADQNAQLAAENVALKKSAPAPFSKLMMEALDTYHSKADDVPELAMLSAYVKLRDGLKIPATDRIVAGIKADGVEEFLKGSQLPYQIATVLADYDNADDETLLHVIWSGQPPEPEGDVWHLEYVSRGNAIVREVLKQLREGADK